MTIKQKIEELNAIIKKTNRKIISLKKQEQLKNIDLTELIDVEKAVVNNCKKEIAKLNKELTAIKNATWNESLSFYEKKAKYDQIINEEFHLLYNNI